MIQFKKYLSDITIDDCSRKHELPNLIFKFLGEKNKDGSNKLVNLVMTPDDYILQFRVGNEVFLSSFWSIHLFLG